MDDSHLWELAQRITTRQELLDLGLTVLGLPHHQVNSALTNNRDVDLAAHHILQIWCKQYTSSLEAYTALYTSLKQCGKSQLAAQLQDLVSPGATPASSNPTEVNPYSSPGATSSSATQAKPSSSSKKKSTSFSRKGKLIFVVFLYGVSMTQTMNN